MAGVPGMRRTGERTRCDRDRAWDAMRILRQFTAADLCTTAEIGEDNAWRYLRGLAANGYLLQVRGTVSGAVGGHALWRLIKNTGPHAPRLHADGFLYDPNTRQVLDPATRAAGGAPTGARP